MALDPLRKGWVLDLPPAGMRRPGARAPQRRRGQPSVCAAFTIRCARMALASVTDARVALKYAPQERTCSGASEIPCMVYGHDSALRATALSRCSIYKYPGGFLGYDED